ncbi:MAG: radical SAM protein [Candidatus Roizmanbacteria bacterium]|nr:radical SAM protein [Candidatus Roizmanbacteria bacterium]
MKFYIETFGCQQNHADSQRIEAGFLARGLTPVQHYKRANYVVINTCMVREKAENKVYGLVHNLGLLKKEKQKSDIFFKIIVTGCMVGLAFRDKSGKYLERLKSIMPEVDEFMPIEEVGFDTMPIRSIEGTALVPISNGCNNFCTFCVVPFTRGREISKPFQDVMTECTTLKNKGCETVLLLGQNVNSYGADLILGTNNVQKIRDLDITYFNKNVLKNEFSFIDEHRKTQKLKPIFVKHLGRYRLPTLFPHLLEKVAQVGFTKVDFMSSNPWDFSDELIDVIAQNKNITRSIHLPVQSGDDAVLKKMNRWYSVSEYLSLVEKLKKRVKNVRISTDVIVGFCGETNSQFENTYNLCKQVGFDKAYISIYSPRPFTAATKVMPDDVTHKVKKERWERLERLINSKHYKD